MSEKLKFTQALDPILEKINDLTIHASLCEVVNELYNSIQNYSDGQSAYRKLLDFIIEQYNASGDPEWLEIYTTASKALFHFVLPKLE